MVASELFLDPTRRAVESWLYGWMNGGQDKDGWGVVGLSAGNGCNCIYFVRRPFFACSAEGAVLSAADMSAAARTSACSRCRPSFPAFRSQGNIRSGG